MENYFRGVWDLTTVSDFVNSHTYLLKQQMEKSKWNWMERCSIIHRVGSFWLKGGAIKGMCERKGDTRVRMTRQDSGRLEAWSECLELWDL